MILRKGDFIAEDEERAALIAQIRVAKPYPEAYLGNLPTDRLWGFYMSLYAPRPKKGRYLIPKEDPGQPIDERPISETRDGEEWILADSGNYEAIDD